MHTQLFVNDFRNKLQWLEEIYHSALESMRGPGGESGHGIVHINVNYQIHVRGLAARSKSGHGILHISVNYQIHVRRPEANLA